MNKKKKKRKEFSIVARKSSNIFKGRKIVRVFTTFPVFQKTDKHVTEKYLTLLRQREYYPNNRHRGGLAVKHPIEGATADRGLDL